MDVKTAFLKGFIKRRVVYDATRKFFINPKDANKVCKLQQSINGLVQASQSWNIRFDSVIKVYGFIQTFGEACIYKKVNGSTTTFLISICGWHIVDSKWCRISGKHKRLFEECFSKEDLDKAAYILGIKIYRDRSRRLINFSMSTYLDKFFEVVQKWNSQRRRSCLCCKVWTWVKTQTRPRQKIEREWKVIPYAPVIGSIKYAMLCTRPIVYLALSLAREYNFLIYK